MGSHMQEKPFAIGDRVRFQSYSVNRWYEGEVTLVTSGVQGELQVSYRYLDGLATIPLASCLKVEAASPFVIGQRVRRRDKRGAGSMWGIGYVTQTNPLKVTINDDPNDEVGLHWDEVMAIEEA